MSGVATRARPWLPNLPGRQRIGTMFSVTTAGVVTLGLLAPLLFARPTFASLGRLPVILAWLVTIYASARLSSLMASGANQPISLTFWLFVYVWMGLGALANTVSQQFPLFGQTFTDATETGALMTIMLGLAGYEVGRRVATARAAGDVSLLNVYSVRWHRVRIVGTAGVAVVLYFTLKYGLATRFSSRNSATQAFFGSSGAAFLQNNKASALLQISLDWMLVFVALFLYAYDWRLARQSGRQARNNVRPPRQVWSISFAVLVAAVILADNPLSNPRYRFGGIAIALMLAVWPLSTPRRFRLVAAGLIFAALFVYPYAAVFRTQQRVLQLAPLNTQFRTSPDFAMFQQELNAQVYVQQNGYTMGRQLEGVLLGWVPRSVWPSKPGTTGSLILAKFSSVLPTSVSLFGSSYVDGGDLWVLLVLAAYGWATAKLERAYARRPRGSAHPRCGGRSTIRSVSNLPGSRRLAARGWGARARRPGLGRVLLSVLGQGATIGHEDLAYREVPR